MNLWMCESNELLIAWAWDALACTAKASKPMSCSAGGDKANEHLGAEMEGISGVA